MANQEFSKDIRELEQQNDDLERTNRFASIYQIYFSMFHVYIFIDIFIYFPRTATSKGVLLWATIKQSPDIAVVVESFQFFGLNIVKYN